MKSFDPNLYKHNYRLQLAYDGTNYHGWQIQPSKLSIQKLVQDACQQILKEEVKVIGSGRTDSGVHALGQVAHFRCLQATDPYRFLASLNGLLPKDIRCQAVTEVDLSFHAQYSAQGKIYRYHLSLDRYQLPFHRLYSHHVRGPFDLDALKQALPLFMGTHDFTSFANKPEEGSASRNAVRTLRKIALLEEQGQLILEFEGNGFLYKMVRNITGTLLAIAAGKLPVAAIPQIFAAKDRRQACQTAPACGLFLVQVLY